MELNKNEVTGKNVHFICIKTPNTNKFPFYLYRIKMFFRINDAILVHNTPLFAEYLRCEYKGAHVIETNGDDILARNTLSFGKRILVFKTCGSQPVQMPAGIPFLEYS